MTDMRALTSSGGYDLWMRQCKCAPWIGEIDYSLAVPRCTNCGQEAKKYRVSTTNGTSIPTEEDE